VGEIPSDNNFDAIDSRHSKVKSVFWIFCRYLLSGNELFGESSRLVVNIEHRERLNGLNSHLGLIGITFSCLFKNERDSGDTIPISITSGWPVTRILISTTRQGFSH